MDEQMNLKVSASPHVRSKDTTSDIMFDVVLALVPATAFGLYLFGWYAALLVATCIVSCVAFEALFEKCLGKKITVGDFSAVLTGLLPGMNLPPRLPIWMAVLGSAFAIIVVKQLFGGLGQNFMNPALGARCFLLLSFSRYMTAFYYDGVATATPLAVLRSTGTVELRNMFFGHTAGTIGETSVVALLIGALYLVARRIISLRIPLAYIGTFSVCIVIYGLVNDCNVPVFLAAHLCGGGLMLGAFFMATDYVTSPITPVGKIIFGIFLGLLTFVLRIFGPSAEGVSYSIIIGNLIVPLIEKVTVPKAFGADAGKKEEKKEAEEKEETPAKKEETPAEKPKADVKGVMLAILAITLITVLMGSILGVVHEVTKDPIAQVEKDAKEDAYKEVFPEAGSVLSFEDAGLLAEQEEAYIKQVNDTVATVRGYENSEVTEISFACKEPAGTADNQVLGYVVLVKGHKGYGGDMELAVGVAADGTVKGISFLSINETAGLGMKANTDAFKNQFVGKNVEEFKFTKTGSTSENEIDALSGATITTTAVTEAVNTAIACVSLLGGGN